MGELTWEHDTEEGECFDIRVTYDYIPYTPARITADPYYSEPPEGGYCEDIFFEVTGYRQYDEDGNVTLDLEKLTPEQTKEYTTKFETIYENSLSLQDRIQEACSKDAESDRDYYDD